MPWPQSDGSTGPDWLGHETWMLNKQSFSWLEGTGGVCFLAFLLVTDNAKDNLTLSKVHYLKTNSAEGWITSDGYAYFTRYVQTQPSTELITEETQAQTDPESDGTWLGSCMYPTSPDAPDPFDPAVEIALNLRFSVVALGLQSGEITFISFPSYGDPLVPPKVIQLPDISLRGTCGRVNALEWTSDGYALAVGWDHGWAVISVGGRFLTWVVGERKSSPW